MVFNHFQADSRPWFRIYRSKQDIAGHVCGTQFLSQLEPPAIDVQSGYCLSNVAFLKLARVFAMIIFLGWFLERWCPKFEWINTLKACFPDSNYSQRIRAHSIIIPPKGFKSNISNILLKSTNIFLECYIVLPETSSQNIRSRKLSDFRNASSGSL